MRESRGERPITGRSPLLYAYWLPFSDEMRRLPPTNDSRGEANAFASEIIWLGIQLVAKFCCFKLDFLKRQRCDGTIIKSGKAGLSMFCITEHDTSQSPLVSAIGTGDGLLFRNAFPMREML